MSSSGSSWQEMRSVGSSLAFVKPMPKRGIGASTGRDSSVEMPPLEPQAASAMELWSQLQPPPTPDSQERVAIRPCQLGHFQVEEQIGRGGMGAVFRAVDTRLDRVVALKVLSPVQSNDQSSIERFRNEARAAARMDHENIARVYYVGEDQGLPFIAFEFVHGVNVRELIEKQRTLSPVDTVNYALQIASALRHTDAAGVVHRDIKPSNIIITPVGRAKLVDLGLARKRDPEASQDLTVDGTTLGTFDYISPEQAKDPRNVDVRSDIYSLGCTMYHMLAGEPPYPVGTVLQKLLDHQGKDIPDAAEANPRVPPELSAVVRKMMASDPRDRYATPNELIDDLSSIALRFGLRPLPADGVVWREPHPPQGWDLWKKYSGWIITAAMLLVVVFVIDRAQRMGPQRQVAAVPPAPERNLNGSESENSLEPGRLPSGDSRTQENPPTQSDNPVGPPPSGSNDERETSVGDNGRAPSSSITDVFRPLPNDAVPPLISDGTRSTATPAGDPDGTSGNGKTGAEQSVPSTATTAGERNSGGQSEEQPPSSIPSVDPFVLVVNSVPQGSYPTLEAACTAAPDNAVIELQFNGDRELPQAPVKIVGKQLILRAAKDYRPTVRFAVSEGHLTAGHQEFVRMISVAGGSLDLYNIDFKLAVDSSLNVGQWVLLSLVDVSHLEMHGVSVTVENATLRPGAILLERDESTRAPYVERGQSPVRIVATDCFFRGEADLILDKTIDPAEIRFDNVAVALDGTMVRLEGTDTYDVLTDMNKGHNIEFELKHVTAMVSGGLAQLDVQQNHSVPRLVISVGDSVVASAPAPLIAMQGTLDVLDFRERLSWSDEATFVFSPDPVWTIAGAGTRREFARSEFDGLWNASGRRTLAGSVDDVLPSRNGRRFAEMTREHLQLAPAPNPAIGGASDLTDAGVDWDEVKFPRLKEQARSEPVSVPD